MESYRVLLWLFDICRNHAWRKIRTHGEGVTQMTAKNFRRGPNVLSENIKNDERVEHEVWVVSEPSSIIPYINDAGY